MSEQVWHIQGPGNAYTPDEMACITRAAQAFLDVVSAVGAPQSHHGVVLDDLTVLPGSIKVNWPQPGDATASSAIPEHLEGAEVAQWLADQPVQVAPDPGWPAAHPA